MPNPSSHQVPPSAAAEKETPLPCDVWERYTMALDNSTTLPGGHRVVSIDGLVLMKLMANRDQDRVHLRDMIDIGLVDRTLLAGLPTELASRLEALLETTGH